MIYVYALAAWGCLVMTSVIIDAIAMYRSLAGCYGEAVLAATLNAADRVGGVPKWVISSLMLDMLMPWLTFYGLLIVYQTNARKESRAHTPGRWNPDAGDPR
jgi:hypothetical protein